jgi:hypothetical protein
MASDILFKYLCRTTEKDFWSPLRATIATDRVSLRGYCAKRTIWTRKTSGIKWSGETRTRPNR